MHVQMLSLICCVGRAGFLIYVGVLLENAFMPESVVAEAAT